MMKRIHLVCKINKLNEQFSEQLQAIKKNITIISLMNNTTFSLARTVVQLRPASSLGVSAELNPRLISEVNWLTVSLLVWTYVCGLYLWHDWSLSYLKKTNFLYIFLLHSLDCCIISWLHLPAYETDAVGEPQGGREIPQLFLLKYANW